MLIEMIPWHNKENTFGRNHLPYGTSKRGGQSLEAVPSDVEKGIIKMLCSMQGRIGGGC